MLSKTRGIVLHYQAYNDKYSIVQVYTEEFGKVAYFVSRSGNRKLKMHRNMFHVLSVLDLEVEHLNLRDIQRIKEAKPCLVLASLLSDPRKISVGMFVAEFILRVSKDIQNNKWLFGFILDSIRILDMVDRGIANFHLVFLMKMSYFLGVYPNSEGGEANCFFDMREGVFDKVQPAHPHFLNRQESGAFLRLLRMNYENMHVFRFSRRDRVYILSRILEYYRIHFPELPELKSLDVLQSVFD